MSYFLLWVTFVAICTVYIVLEVSGALTIKRILFGSILGALLGYTIILGVPVAIGALIFFIFHPESYLNNPKSFINRPFIIKKQKEN